MTSAVLHGHEPRYTKEGWSNVLFVGGPSNRLEEAQAVGGGRLVCLLVEKVGKVLLCAMTAISCAAAAKFSSAVGGRVCWARCIDAEAHVLELL